MKIIIVVGFMYSVMRNFTEQAPSILLFSRLLFKYTIRVIGNCHCSRLRLSFIRRRGFSDSDSDT